MSDALRGVMWSFASHSSCWVNQITSLKPCARFIWRCFTVAVVAMSLRAFYDRTLIVEALFYTESYFRIQYVLLYDKCIVWRKLNKCCLKTEGCFAVFVSLCVSLFRLITAACSMTYFLHMLTFDPRKTRVSYFVFFETSSKPKAQKLWVRLCFQMWFNADKTLMSKSYL